LELRNEVEKGIEKGEIEPCLTNFIVEDDEKSFKYLFCHECDIHFISSDKDSVDANLLLFSNSPDVNIVYRRIKPAMVDKTWSDWEVAFEK